MADYTKLDADLAELSTKLDILIAKQAPTPPVDEQPAVDAADAQVQAMIAKIPA